MAHRRCLSKLNNLDFWYNSYGSKIKIGLNKNCLDRIGQIEHIQFYHENLNKYTLENNIIGNISTYNYTFDIDLHLPLRGYISNFNTTNLKLNNNSWLIEILDDDYYLQSEYYKYEYGL